MAEDDELEELRRRKLQELQKTAMEQQMVEEQKKAQELEQARKMQILRQILTPEARERLANVRLVRPDLVDNVENQLVQLASMGRLNRMLTDAEVRDILLKFTGGRKETKIERRSK